MRRFSIPSRAPLSLATAGCLLASTLGSFIFAGAASAATPANNYVSLNGSYISAPAGAKLSGSHANNQQITVTMVLKPNNETQLNNLLNAMYTPGSSQYHNWLGKGQFNALFAPTTAQRAQVTSFLQKAGLKVVNSSSPFLEEATGTTSQVEATFKTHINDYKAANGKAFFQNDTEVQIPATLAGSVEAVSGLSNTDRLHTNYVTTHNAAQAQGKTTPKYGAGVNGSGLTPSQLSSLYDANPVYALGSRGQGKGVTLAVFELSGYTKSNITTYEHQYFGASENVPVVDVNVDGGPITPICPTGDTCGVNPGQPDYSGDIEVVADIETQIAVAPKASKILVYNAPNDYLGITVADEYFKIANDDLADSVSSSWGACEPDAGKGQIEAESLAFAQMAAQGQSVFSAAGDTGAFDCLRGSGNTGLTVDDPSSQPFVTAVGGTSFEAYDPGKNQHPSYPQSGETVWNVLNACKGTAYGLGQCANLGAGGGGVSSFWARPAYQYGPGVTSSYSQKGPYCSNAANGQYCREIPDVSANADEYTPYSEYCTGDPTTNSTCGAYGLTWFGIGGTSLATPVWSAVIGLWDSVHNSRFGSANYGLYQLFRSNSAYSKYYHDVTGKNQTENNNGYYPVTPEYDMATGIGTPRIAGIVAAKF